MQLFLSNLIKFANKFLIKFPCSNSKYWPLLIDPQGQANKWIKKYEKKFNLSITRLHEPKYQKVLENCITFGQPVNDPNLY